MVSTATRALAGWMEKNAAAGRWVFRWQARRMPYMGPWDSSSVRFPRHRPKRPRRPFPLLAAGAAAPFENPTGGMTSEPSDFCGGAAPVKQHIQTRNDRPQPRRRRCAPEVWAPTEHRPPIHRGAAALVSGSVPALGRTITRPRGLDGKECGRRPVGFSMASETHALHGTLGFLVGEVSTPQP
jgi:hypothetical protein